MVMHARFLVQRGELGGRAVDHHGRVLEIVFQQVRAIAILRRRYGFRLHPFGYGILSALVAW
jgi:hypothetical protein